MTGMQQTEVTSDYKTLAVTSEAFQNGEVIPKKYTCEGEDINPPLNISEIPAQAKSLVIIVEDPDAPSGTWLHWLVWNIPVTHHIRENGIPGVQGKNDFGRNDYGGPCPPSGTHRYIFKVYALDCLIDLPEGSVRRDIDVAMSGHITAFGELEGKYKKTGKSK